LARWPTKTIFKGINMSMLTWSHIIICIGIIFTAAGGLGSYYFGKIEADKKDAASLKSQKAFQLRITDLQNKLMAVEKNTANMDQKLTLIAKSADAKTQKWFEAKAIAPVIADFILLKFRSSGGAISGNIRIKGSDTAYPFSTKVNDTIPLAIKNLWLQNKKQYMSDPILEYEITQTTDEKDSLSIFSAGFKMSSGM
jgi:hypothetical protein